MSAETCTRVRDAASSGRLWGDAAISEHATACEVCARELAALKKRRDFRDAFPVLTSIADQSEPSPTRARVNASGAALKTSRRHLFLMIATLVAMVGFFARRNVLRAPSAQPEGDEMVTAPPTFRIANIENALFESKVEGGTVRASLTRGVAAFHVERLGPRQRFLLAVPDGEVEVRGTLFVVTIEGGKTRSVEVNEGTVEVRLQGRATMVLSDGERWPSSGADRPTVSFVRIPSRADAAAPEPSKPND